MTKDDQIFIVCLQSHLNFPHTSGPEWAKTKIIVLLFRESTFITPRGGGMKMTRCLEKSSYFYRAPVEVIGKFSMPPHQVFKIFNAPPLEFGIEGVHPEFSLIIVIQFAVPQDV